VRFLHTADWHLGRLFHGQSLVEDQALLLDQVIDVAREGAVDAILIAGDVFDRALPPSDAVALFDDFLSRAALDLGVAVVAIAGNHDSAQRLGFGARLLSGSRVHIVGPLPSAETAGAGIAFEDRHGEVRVHALPYADPAITRHALGRDDLSNHDESMDALVAGIRARHPVGARSVLVAHAFVAGGEDCESERPLSVGGSGRVDAGRFAGFDYVALGHLHRPQRVGSDHIRYAGSLAKYSFSEVAHEKSLSLVDLAGDGAVNVETVGLHARRDVRRIEGELASLLTDPPEAGREDYLCVSLLDAGALLDPIGRLRAVYPNVMQVERPLIGAEQGATTSVQAQRTRTPDQLFADFFEQVEQRELSEAERAAYHTVASAALRASVEGDVG
jgi:exonuclease SbcD